MSKEMTPKEALRGILLQALFINPNTKIKEEINNKMFALREIVEKALNSLEETNFNYHNALAFCEASKEEKQELYKQIKQLEKENQELRNKLNINFEDCADELCEALTQRDKLYDENLELQKENQELKEKISKFEKPILYMCRDRRSRELERLRLLELVNTYNVPILLNDFETVKELEKLKKVIDILKEKANIRLHILTNTDGSKIYEIEFIFTYYSTIHEITQQQYELLKEVLENV